MSETKERCDIGWECECGALCGCYCKCIIQDDIDLAVSVGGRDPDFKPTHPDERL